MIKNICFLEDKEDFEILFNKIKYENCLFVPLDIKTFLICKKNKLNIFDFNRYLTNKFHETALEETKKFTETIKFKNQLAYSLQSEIVGYLRFRLHSIIFIIEIIEKILAKYKIDKIFVSGIAKKNHKLHEVKICSEIINELYPNLTHNLSRNLHEEKHKEIYKYITNKPLLNKSKKVLLSNGGYNFKRLRKKFKEAGFKTWISLFGKVHFYEKIFYFVKGYNLIHFTIDKKSKVKEKIFIEKINFNYKNKYNLSNLLNNLNSKLSYYFNDLYQKTITLKKFINENNFSLLISNVARGLDGAILDHDLKQPSLCIPHGIISKSLNNYDLLYKKNIAEAVFNGESNYFAIQSKIMHQSLETHKFRGKPIITGNLIFSHNTNKGNYKNKHLLYATTLKGFTNMQYLGVDMFYEFWEILNELNDLSKEMKLKIIVKIHPQFSTCKNELAKHFKSLKFTNCRIDKLLKNAFSLITLSSGTIEDALNSKVPVILYDYKKRYKQLECSSKYRKEESVYYINSKNEIKLLLEQIKESEKPKFDNYIYEGTFNNNFDQKVLPIINKK